MIKYLLLIVLIFPTFVQAEKQMILLEKGEEAPYSGILANEDQMKEFRQINEEKKLCKEKEIKLKQLGELQEANLNWYKENYYNLKKDYEWKQTSNFFTHTLYFLGGVVLTGAISYGTIKYLRKD